MFINYNYIIAIILTVIAFALIFIMFIHFKKKAEYLERKNKFIFVFTNYLFNKYIHDMNMDEEKIKDFVKNIEKDLNEIKGEKI